MNESDYGLSENDTFINNRIIVLVQNKQSFSSSNIFNTSAFFLEKELFSLAVYFRI